MPVVNSQPAKPLGLYDFSRELLRRNDLDPVYVVLWQAGLESQLLERWLLAYTCFYHVGTASWICEQPGYWDAMHQAAASKDYPRSSERRHFRGRAAIEAIAWLQQRGVPALFDPIHQQWSWMAEELMRYVRTWRNFGSWAVFKVADLVERLGLAEVTFSPEILLYDNPRQGAELLWQEEGCPTLPLGGSVAAWAMERLARELGVSPAPPRYERPVGIQEYETMLCKWKSYRNGHYHLGEDVRATRYGLLWSARCKLSQRLLRAGREGGLW